MKLLSNFIQFSAFQLLMLFNVIQTDLALAQNQTEREFRREIKKEIREEKRKERHEKRAESHNRNTGETDNRSIVAIDTLKALEGYSHADDHVDSFGRATAPVAEEGLEEGGQADNVNPIQMNTADRVIDSTQKADQHESDGLTIENFFRVRATSYTEAFWYAFFKSALVVFLVMIFFKMQRNTVSDGRFKTGKRYIPLNVGDQLHAALYGVVSGLFFAIFMVVRFFVASNF